MDRKIVLFIIDLNRTIETHYCKSNFKNYIVFFLVRSVGLFQICYDVKDSYKILQFNNFCVLLVPQRKLKN